MDTLYYDSEYNTDDNVEVNFVEAYERSIDELAYAALGIVIANASLEAARTDVDLANAIKKVASAERCYINASDIFNFKREKLLSEEKQNAEKAIIISDKIDYDEALAVANAIDAEHSAAELAEADRVEEFINEENSYTTPMIRSPYVIDV